MQEIQEMRVWYLAQEDSLGKEMATCSSILAGKIPWTEEPGGLQSMGLQKVGHDWAHTEQIKPQDTAKCNIAIVFYSGSIFILLKQICIILRKMLTVSLF